MVRAASITPRSTSSRLVSTMRATKGLAAMVRGMMAAVAPMEVPAMKRVRGMIKIIKMTKGRLRRMLMNPPNTVLKRGMGSTPPFLVVVSSTPRGRPIK